MKLQLLFLSSITISSSTLIAFPSNTTFTPTVDPSINDHEVSLFVLGLIKTCFPNATDLAQHVSAMTILDCGLWDGTIAEDDQYTFSVLQPSACYDLYSPWREGITTQDIIECVISEESPDRKSAIARAPNNTTSIDPSPSNEDVYLEALSLMQVCFPNSTDLVQHIGATAVLRCGLLSTSDHEYSDS